MLSAQQALALIATGHSQRQIAATLGVSHQKIGRWLREGQPDGVKVIPSSIVPMLQVLLNIHAEQSFQQAQADSIPYSKDYPVFAYRPLEVPEADGKMRPQNMRMFIDGTQFIRDDLRRKIFYSMWITDDFLKASIASVIDWLKYVQERFLTLSEQRSMTTQHLLRDYTGGGLPHDQKVKVLMRENIIKPIWTKSTPTYSGLYKNKIMFDQFYETIEQKLKDRHQNAAEEYAYRYVFQIKSEKTRYEEKRGRKIVAAKKARGKKHK